VSCHDRHVLIRQRCPLRVHGVDLAGPGQVDGQPATFGQVEPGGPGHDLAEEVDHPEELALVVPGDLVEEREIIGLYQQQSPGADRLFAHPLVRNRPARVVRDAPERGTREQVDRPFGERALTQRFLVEGELIGGGGASIRGLPDVHAITQGATQTLPIHDAEEHRPVPVMGGIHGAEVPPPSVIEELHRVADRQELLDLAVGRTMNYELVELLRPPDEFMFRIWEVPVDPTPLLGPVEEASKRRVPLVVGDERWRFQPVSGKLSIQPFDPGEGNRAYLATPKTVEGEKRTCHQPALHPECRVVDSNQPRFESLGDAG